MGRDGQSLRGCSTKAGSTAHVCLPGLRFTTSQPRLGFDSTASE